MTRQNVTKIHLGGFPRNIKRRVAGHQRSRDTVDYVAAAGTPDEICWLVIRRWRSRGMIKQESENEREKKREERGKLRFGSAE